MLYNDTSFASKSNSPTRLNLPFSAHSSFKLGLVLFSILSLMWMGKQCFNQSLFPIRYVKILAADQAVHLVINKALNDVKEESNHGINLLTLKSYLKNLSWIDQVRTWHVLPWTLIISVTKREPVATWQASLNNRPTVTQCIDYKGTIFKAAPFMTIKNKPKLVGAKEQLNELLHIYHGLSTLLRPQSLEVSRITLDQKQRCAITLTNNMQLLFGHFDPYVQLQKLLEIHPAALHQTETIATIDLRYPSGMAITQCRHTT